MTVQKEGAYDPQTHLSFGDSAVDNAKIPAIIKTDQARIGVKIFIGRTGDELFPVTALLLGNKREQSRPTIQVEGRILPIQSKIRGRSAVSPD